MVVIKLDTEKIQLIGLFETITHTSVKDCITNKEKRRVTFVVNEGGAGKAIGKNGANVKNIERVIGKKIEIIEYSDDPVKFVSFLLRPSMVQDGFISEKNNGRKALNITLSKKVDLDRGKINKARSMLKRYFLIDDLIIN